MHSNPDALSAALTQRVAHYAISSQAAGDERAVGRKPSQSCGSAAQYKAVDGEESYTNFVSHEFRVNLAL